MKRCLTMLLFVLLAAGAVAAQTARVGHEFKLKAGQVVTLDGGRLRIRFARVESDSRCPVDVTCVWAGNAELSFEVGARNWKEKTTLKLNTNASPERASEGQDGHYTLKLVSLSPRLRSNQKIKPGQYTATLLVTKD